MLAQIVNTFSCSGAKATVNLVPQTAKASAQILLKAGHLQLINILKVSTWQYTEGITNVSSVSLQPLSNKKIL